MSVLIWFKGSFRGGFFQESHSQAGLDHDRHDDDVGDDNGACFDYYDDDDVDINDKGLFTYYVSQKQGFLHPPSPLRHQWSAFG